MTNSSEQPEAQNSEKSNSGTDKSSQRILAVGATLGIVLLSLGAVVWALGNANLDLRLKLKK